MKLPCKVVEDLLPIYYDGICSVESRTMVDEHVSQCSSCQKILSELNTDIEVTQEKVDDLKPLKKIKKRINRIRMRWIAVLLAVISLIPIAFLSWNEYSAQGVALSNQDELSMANVFMTCLTDGDYARAYTYLDIESKKNYWLSDWFTEDELVNMYADGLEKFCALGEKVEEAGGIDAFEYIGTSASYGVNFRGSRVHQVSYRIKYGGNEQQIYVDVSENGVSGFSSGGSFLTDPLAQLCIWGEYLWQDYQGCYYDPEMKTYIYYDTQ